MFTLWRGVHFMIAIDMYSRKDKRTKQGEQLIVEAWFEILTSFKNIFELWVIYEMNQSQRALVKPIANYLEQLECFKHHKQAEQ